MKLKNLNGGEIDATGTLLLSRNEVGLHLEKCSHLCLTKWTIHSVAGSPNGGRWNRLRAKWLATVAAMRFIWLGRGER